MDSEQKDIKDFVNGLKLEENVSPEDFYQAVKSAYKDRTRQVYFIWKKLKEL